MGGPPPDSPLRGVTSRLLFAAGFDASRFAEVRRHVDVIAAQCGLAPEKTVDFVAAVNEVMTNAIRHGGGRGELRLWRDSHLICEVRDHGPGFAAEKYVARRDRPAPSPTGGMGLWIVQQTSEVLAIDSDGAGTTVRISTALPPR
ncbi:ATP-binding protein [Micromonospora sp. NPDC049559]|uniref:ATP-binding protein n=1 Tax=Micromonospora sp. NPDC049559 TaxID=3155923 RepID=UPI003426E30F